MLLLHKQLHRDVHLGKNWNLMLGRSILTTQLKSHLKME